MNSKEQHLESLSEIRSLMQQSSKFISLSGLAGVSAGITGLIGAAAAYFYMQDRNGTYEYVQRAVGITYTEFIRFFIIDAALVLVVATAFAIFFTRRKARQQNLPAWDSTSKRLLLNLFIPVVSGGLFCILMLNQGIVIMIASAMLIFYGLGLINASKYTLGEIRWLGLTEIALGLLAAMFPRNGLLFWALGFGVMHIVYGAFMYMKYEQ